MDLKVALLAADRDALAPDYVEVRTQKEVNVMTVAAELCAVKTADRTTTNNCNLHLLREPGSGPNSNKTLVTLFGGVATAIETALSSLDRALLRSIWRRDWLYWAEAWDGGSSRINSALRFFDQEA